MDSEAHSLYTSSELNGLCLAWVLFWLLCHQTCWTICSRRAVDILMCRPARDSEIYSRRICRSQIYCTICVLAAIALLARCRRLPEDLLNDYTSQHQVFFSMAVGHWLVSIWEDWRTPRFLCAGLNEKALVGIRDPATFLLHAYTAHHLVAALGFYGVLHLRNCTGIGTFGLLFELPVLLLNRRELAINADVTPKWLLNPREVNKHWQWFYVLFGIARVGPIMVYFYSLGYWQEALGNLSSGEKVLYHGMAVFFTLLNYSFASILLAWHRSDLSAAKYSANENRPNRDDELANSATALDLEDGDEFGCSENSDRCIDPNASPLIEVDESLLEKHDGASPGVSLWVDIDGAAFDVTKFVAEHPSGEEMLKNTGGKDTVESFKLLCKSDSAKSSLVRYMIGPIKYTPTEYSMFNHNEELLRCGKFILAILATFGLKLVLLRVFTLGALLPASLASPVAPALLGLLVSVALGILVGLLTFVWRTVPVPFSINEHIIAIATVVYVVGLMATCENGWAGQSTGFELCAIVVLLQQYSAQKRVLSLYSDCGVVLCVPVGVSWLIRSWGAWTQAASGYLWAAIAGLLVAWGLNKILSQTLGPELSNVFRKPSNPSGRSQDECIAILRRGLSFSSFYGLLGIGVLTCVTPEARPMLQELASAPIGLALSLFGASAISVLALVALASVGFACSIPFATRIAAGTTVLAHVVHGGVFHYAWIALFGFAMHYHSLYVHNRVRLQWNAQIKRFQTEVASHCIGLQALIDIGRLVIATIIWRSLTIPVVSFISYCLPDELRVYACEIPCFDFGPETEVGIAAHVAPNLTAEGECKTQCKRQINPQYFVCNVGQISHKDERGLGDLQKTMNTLREIWEEFQDPPTPGLAANVVAVFPNIEEQGLSKEINFSAWESAKDAHDWYANSPGHKRVLHQHTSGILQTFGNLLCSLQPAAPIRHQDRCKHCMRVVESEEPGKPAPRRCGVCGGPTYRFPLF